MKIQEKAHSTFMLGEHQSNLVDELYFKHNVTLLFPLKSALSKGCLSGSVG